MLRAAKAIMSPRPRVPTRRAAAAPVRGEAAFLAADDAAEFPHPAVTVDVAPMTTVGGALHVLLVRRDEHPGKGKWSLAGGFVGMKESLDDAAARVLTTKAR